MNSPLLTWPSSSTTSLLQLKGDCRSRSGSPFWPPLYGHGVGGSVLRTRRNYNNQAAAGRGRFVMFLNTKPVVKDGVLSFNGIDALKGIPDNVVMTPWSGSSAFLGATSSEDHSTSRIVFKLGVIKYAL